MSAQEGTETFRLPGGGVTRPVLTMALDLLREILAESAKDGEAVDLVEDVADTALEGLGLTYAERCHVVPRMAREAFERADAEIERAIEDAYRWGRAASGRRQSSVRP